MSEKYPLSVIEDVYGYEKYAPRVSLSVQLWSWLQYFFIFLMTMFLFNTITTVGTPWIFVYGAYLFLCIFSMTMLMDKSPYAWLVEIAKSGIGLAVIFATGDWFGLVSYWSEGIYVLAGYFIISAVIVTYFNFTELKEKSKLQVA